MSSSHPQLDTSQAEFQGAFTTAYNAKEELRLALVDQTSPEFKSVLFDFNDSLVRPLVSNLSQRSC
jgi:hypothetical protein